MPRFRQEIAEETIDNLPADATDTVVASAVAEYLITRGPPPFDLRINHDARMAPAPVRIDRRIGRLCGVTLATERVARAWVIEATRLGFIVSRLIGRESDFVGSIADIRARARRRVEDVVRITDDDTIPF